MSMSKIKIINSYDRRHPEAKVGGFISGFPVTCSQELWLFYIVMVATNQDVVYCLSDVADMKLKCIQSPF